MGKRKSNETAAQDAEFYALEMKLLDPQTRRTPGEIDHLIHQDFVEVGSSGDRYDRQSVIEVMSAGSAGAILIKDFETRRLAPSVILATYRSIGESGREARRSSVWVDDQGAWKVIFHQGTRVPDSWFDPIR